MGDPIYIIDGHSQIYRAYYAPFRDLSSPTGEPTRATYVFYTMLLKFLLDRRPRFVAMAVDGPAEKLLRRGVYPEYKATRKPMPDDMPVQVRRIMQIVQAMRIPILAAEGYEADDIIATAAATFATPASPLVVISRDKDLDQIVTDCVTLYEPMNDRTFDAAAIEAEKGYPPAKAVEVQALMGDAIDNIPGIPGVGPKTAAKLIMKYGNADAVLAAADEQTPKLRENLIAHGANIPLARKLATLDRHVPIELTMERMRFAGIDRAAIDPIFRELGFNRLLEQLDQLAKSASPVIMQGAGDTAERPTPQADAKGAGKTSAPRTKRPAPRRAVGSQMGLFDSDEGILPSSAAGVPPASSSASSPSSSISQQQQQHEGKMPSALAGGTPASLAQDPTIREVAAVHIEDKPGITTAADFEYRLVNTPAALAELADRLRDIQALAAAGKPVPLSFDTETTGPNPMWAEMVGMSLSWEAGKAFYLPIKGPLGSEVLPLDAVRDAVGPVLADPLVPKVGQNIKYDIIILAGAAMPVRGPLRDTMVAAHVLDSMRLSYNLESLAADYINHRGIPIQDLIGRGKKQITMDLVPLDQIAVYAAEDADITLRIWQVLEPKLAEMGLTGLFENLEMPLTPVLAEMEQAGIRVDRDVLKKMEVDLRAQADVLKDRAMLAAGHPFNIDSPRQLAEVLFTELKLPVIKRTKTGPSTDVEVLEQLAVQHELPGLILDYRKLSKLVGTYLVSLAEAIHPRTGRVHTCFHQTGAATGRLSSSDPNLQNIPIRTDQGRLIRAAFVAGDGNMLLSADYSQVELRVLAHLCQDPTLTAAFEADQDIHRIVAAEVFGVKVEDVTPQQRARAKTVNFGIIYGQTAYGLSVTLRIDRKEAGEFIFKYRQRFPRIDEFLAACVRAAHEQGYVETIFGRRRRIPEIDSTNQQRRALSERLAINSVVQGSAADLIKEAMVNIAARIKREIRPSRMLLQIHDELVFEVPEAAVESETEMVRQEMSSAIKLSVPLKVDIAAGKNWMEAK